MFVDRIKNISLEISNYFYKPSLPSGFFGHPHTPFIKIKYWANNNCGSLCLLMAIQTLTPQQDISLKEISILVEKMEAFSEDSGYKHMKLAQIARNVGLYAKTQYIGTHLYKIAEYLVDGNVIMASVSPKIYARSIKVGNKNKSGHLILITGVKIENNTILYFVAHDPGTKTYKPKNTVNIVPNQMKEYFSGNIIAIKNFKYKVET